jgi:glyoxylase-like metal-dependent hydrolase (beta-lactamase superfamily II)
LGDISPVTPPFDYSNFPLMLRRLSAGLLATAAFVAPLAATAQEGSAEDLGVAIAFDSEARDQPNIPNIGLCNSLRDDDREWVNTFTANIGSWKLTIRNSKEFHAGNITFLEKMKPENAGKNSKKISIVDHTIAIDSGCPPHANRNISHEIKNTKKSFYLINTHGHHDHILGNSVFSDAGAEIIAHINARKEMAALDDFDSSGLPNITFNDEMNLFVDDIVVRLIHLPSGHTNGDLAIWIPKLDILFTGDTFMTKGYPLIDLRGGTIRGLIKAITVMIQIAGDNTLIIPGHGNLTKKANGNIVGPNKEDLIQYRHMLLTVTEEVEKLKQLGKSLQEINAKKPTQEFDQEWDNNLICPENFISFIYNSLPGKKGGIAPCSNSNRVDFSLPK